MTEYINYLIHLIDKYAFSIVLFFICFYLVVIYLVYQRGGLPDIKDLKTGENGNE